MQIPKNLFYDTLIFLNEIDSVNITCNMPYQNVLKFIRYFYSTFNYDESSPNFSITQFENKWFEITSLLNKQLDECINNGTITKYTSNCNIHVSIKNKDPDIYKTNVNCINYLHNLIVYMMFINQDINNKNEINNKWNYAYNNILKTIKNDKNNNKNEYDIKDEDEDEDSQYITIKSETDKSVQYKINPKCKTCSCKGFYYTNNCKHIKKYVK